MRKRFAKAFAMLAILTALLAVTIAPSAAYDGETEGYVGFRYGGSSTQGCTMQLFVMPWRSVQAWCQMESGSSGAFAQATNWTVYHCDGVYNPYGCTYYIHINAWGAPWHPIGCWEMKRDPYSGQHALIMDCYPE